MTYHVELWNITQGLNPPLDGPRHTHLTRPRPTHAAYGPHVGASVTWGGTPFLRAQSLYKQRESVLWTDGGRHRTTAYTSYAARL